MKRTANIFKLVLSATIFLQLFACKKGLVENQADSLLSESKQRSSLKSLTAPDVYVAGILGGVATYWKNGVATSLPGGTDATGIVVVGTDVYVCGSGFNPATGTSNAAYWVNGGAPTYLTSGTDETMATGIAVSGGSVYVTGRVSFGSNIGAYWKDGVKIPLGSGEANGITISNGNIYIANSEFQLPSYWVNGSKTVCQGVTSNTSVTNIAVSGSTVWVAGFKGGNPKKARLWNTGVEVTTLGTGTNSQPYALATDASGNPLMAGSSGPDLNNQHICYWNPNNLSDPPVTISSGKQVGIMMGITTDPLTGDIYVCGSETDPSSTTAKARYWIINPTTGGISGPTTLGSNATAYAITLQ